MHPVHQTRRGGAGWFRVITFFAFIFHFRFLPFYDFHFLISSSSSSSVFFLAMGEGGCEGGIPGLGFLKVS